MPVILTNDFPPAVGGIQRYIERVAAELHALGHAVVVVAPKSEEPRATLPYDVIPFERDRGRVASMVSMRRALAEARERANDRVTIASSWFPAGVVAARFGGKAPGTLAILAFGTEIVRQDSGFRRAAMRSVFARADAILSISRYTSERLREAGVARAPVVVGCAVDPWNARPAPARVPTILSVGRLVRRKGFDRVIAALPALVRSHRGLVYEIVGDGPDRAYLQAEAMRHGVAQHVRFLESVDDVQLRAAYDRAWCFALAVRREPHDVEGFGIVYLEAAVAGIAAVGGIGSGAEDAIVHGHTGLLVDGTSDAQVAHALDVLLRDRIFAAKLGAAARERALRDFSWRHVGVRIAQSVGLAC
jgi:phosphatidylinositol alpha-1,6-mannosyltransferase